MAIHPATKYTPFELMYGRKCNMPTDLHYQPHITQYIEEEDYITSMKETMKKCGKLQD